MIFPRKALSLALSGLITASCLATVAAPAEAAVPSRANQNYTYGQVTSQYHIYNESTVNRNKPVGIVFFFNGDYYQKYANDTYISYPYRAPLTSLADVALEKI